MMAGTPTPPAAHPTGTAPAPETAETAPSNCGRESVTTGPSAAADAHAPACAAHGTATAPTAGMHTIAGENNTAPTARTPGQVNTKRGPPAEPSTAQKQACFRRWRFQMPNGSITVTQRDRQGTYTHGRPNGWCIDVGERMKRGMTGRHLLRYVPQASRACLGRALNARRRTPPADYGRAPHAGTLPAALGFTLPLPDDVAPLFGSPDEAGVMAALDDVAQQISEGRSITLVEDITQVDSATAHPGAGAAAPLAAWLAQRADELRAADDARVMDDICRRNASTTPAATEAEAAVTTTAETLWAEMIGETPTEGQSPDTPPTPHSPEDATHADRSPPTVDVGAAPAPSELRIVLLAVARHPNPNGRGARLMVCLPPRRNALYGVTEATDATRRRREAMCHEAAGWLDLGCAKEAYFHAGDVQTHPASEPGHSGDSTSHPEAMRTAVITTVLRRPLTGSTLADAAPRHHAGGVWWTLEQLAEDCADPAGEARYRAGAAAIAKVDSYMRPTGDTPHFVRWGVRDEASANGSAAESETAEKRLEQRLRAAAAEAKKLQAILEATPPSGDGDDDGFAEFARALAPFVDTEPGDTLPHELLSFKLPAPPADAALLPFRHTAVIFPTQPLPEPERQPPPEDDFWPHDIHDIVEPWALQEIHGWLEACLRWHRDGGPAHSRPQPIAFGQDAIKPRARGRVWDLRGGPGHVKLFDPTTEPKRTGLNLEFAETEFADIADRELVSMLCHGVQMKTDSMAHQIVLMPNLLSLYSENGGVAAATAQMSEMQKLGFLELFEHLPCVPFRAMPRGVVPKKGTEELRGIGDQGQPRKSLRTRRSGEPVVPLNELSREGEWSHQYMDSLETASHNSAVLLALADLNGESMVDLAFDFSKFFHQLFYDALMLWQMGAIIPRHKGSSDEGDALDFALEYVMTMGATPSSQVAQRFANAIAAAICRRMNALEAARWRDPRLPHELTAQAHEALATRAELPHTCYGTQAALFNVLIYCDDARLACVGAERAARLLHVFHDVVGKRGLRLPLSRMEKQQSGVGVVWLGAHLSSALGLIWVPKDKATKAAASLCTALRGELAVGEYRRLLGYLVSLLFMVGGDKRLLHHIFRPVKPGEEIDFGPATLVTVDELMRAVLNRWLALIMDVPGASMLAAFAPTRPPSTTPRHRIRADAALEGTPSPGLGGWLYGHWFALAIADKPGLERLDIPHLELIAAGLAIITFAELLTGASLVCIETDALATATSLTKRARTPAMQVILDSLLASPSYNALAPRLLVAHCSGAGNPMADAASRGYASTLAALSEALGVTSTRVPLGDEAMAFVQRAIDGLAPITTAREREHPTAQAPRRPAASTAGGAAKPSPSGGSATQGEPPRRRRGSPEPAPPAPAAIERTLTEEERQAGRQRMNTASSGPSPYVYGADTPSPPHTTEARPIARPPAAYHGSPPPMPTRRMPPPWQRSHWQRELAQSVTRGAGTATPRPHLRNTPRVAALRPLIGGTGRPGTTPERRPTAPKHGANRTPPAHSPPKPKRERTVCTVYVPETPPPRTPRPATSPSQPVTPPTPQSTHRRAPEPRRELPRRAAPSPPSGYFSPSATSRATPGLPRRTTAPTASVPAGGGDRALDPHVRVTSRLVRVPGGLVTSGCAPPTERGVGGANARALRADREGLVERTYEMLRDDRSEHAVHADDDIIRWLADVATNGDPVQAPLTTQAQRGSNWRWWKRYCSFIGVISPWRPDNASLDSDGQNREAAIWAGALMWIYGRMQPRKGRFLPEGPPHFGRPKPPSPLSALAVLRGVRAEHVARGINPPSLALATRRAHEQMLKYSREIGPENCVPQRAIPMTHELICKLLSIPDGECILKGGKPWHWTTSYGLGIRTAIHVLAQCGFRKSEIALLLGKWGPEKLSFASVKWLIDGEIVLHPSAEQLRSLKEGDYAIIMPGASKADCFGMRWGNNPIWLPYDPDAAINAAYALSIWELHANVEADKRRTTPLFCGPEGVGTPLKAAALDELFFRMMSYVLRDEALAKKYSIHGFRSYLASALLAAGCSGPEIQAALRWASDEALKIYQVVQRETYGGWLIRAERIKLTGARASSLHAEGRHPPVYEPENMIADALGTREAMRSQAEQADNADIGIIRDLGVEGIVNQDADA